MPTADLPKYENAAAQSPSRTLDACRKWNGQKLHVAAAKPFVLAQHSDLEPSLHEPKYEARPNQRNRGTTPNGCPKEKKPTQEYEG